MRVLVLSLLMSVSVGCSDDSTDPSSSDASNGPLSVGDTSGAISLPPAKRGRVSAVFGDLFLCTKNGQPATITGVNFTTTVHPVAVRGAVREIPAAEDRDDPNSDRWMPNIAKYGNPFDGKLRARLGGTIIDDDEGAVISDRCSERRPDSALAELLTWVAAGPHGAVVRSQSIQYEAGGHQYHLIVPWRFTICGSQVDDPDCKRYAARRRR